MPPFKPKGSLRNWQSLNALNYSPANELEWNQMAFDIDLAIVSSFAPELNARNTDMYRMQYMDWLIWTGDDNPSGDFYPKLVAWAVANGYDHEDAFLHFWDDTKGSYYKEGVLRIFETKGWGGGTATTRAQSRARTGNYGQDKSLFNPRSPVMRKFMAYYFRDQIYNQGPSHTHGGTTGDWRVDGIFIDASDQGWPVYYKYNLYGKTGYGAFIDCDPTAGNNTVIRGSVGSPFPAFYRHPDGTVTTVYYTGQAQCSDAHGGHYAEYADRLGNHLLNTSAGFATQFVEDTMEAFAEIRGNMGTDEHKGGDHRMFVNGGQIEHNSMHVAYSKPAGGMLTEWWVAEDMQYITKTFRLARRCAIDSTVMLWAQSHQGPTNYTTGGGNYADAPTRHQLTGVALGLLNNQGPYFFYQQRIEGNLNETVPARLVDLGSPLGTKPKLWKIGSDPLGQPINIWRRDYEDGIVLFRAAISTNVYSVPCDNEQKTVALTLPGTFRRLKIDNTWDAASVSTVQLAGAEGVILKRVTTAADVWPTDITVTASSHNGQPDQQITFTINYSNTSGMNLDYVNMQFVIDPMFTYVSCTGNGKLSTDVWSDQDAVSWDNFASPYSAISIANGGSGSRTVTVKVKNPTVTPAGAPAGWIEQAQPGHKAACWAEIYGQLVGNQVAYGVSDDVFVTIQPSAGTSPVVTSAEVFKDWSVGLPPCRVPKFKVGYYDAIDSQHTYNFNVNDTDIIWSNVRFYYSNQPTNKYVRMIGIVEEHHGRYYLNDGTRTTNWILFDSALLAPYSAVNPASPPTDVPLLVMIDTSNLENEPIAGNQYTFDGSLTLIPYVAPFFGYNEAPAYGWNGQPTIIPFDTGGGPPPPPSPPAISNVRYSGLAANSVTILWDTDQFSDSRVNYGINTSYGQYVADYISTKTHSINLVGLQPGITHHYQVVSTNANGTTTSIDYTFVTSASATPTITNVIVSALSDDSATITWDTDQLADSRVDYGITDSYGDYSYDDTDVNHHSVIIGNLISETLYHFQCSSANDSGAGESIDYTFETEETPPADTIAPIISGVVTDVNTSISAVLTWTIGATSASVSWTTDEPSTGEVNYGLSTSYDNSKSSPVATTVHNVLLTGLQANSVYHFQITATDVSDNIRYSIDYTFTTSISPPTDIAYMRIWNEGDDQPDWIAYSATISWVLKGASGGTKVVNAQFKDNQGHISPVCSASIVLTSPTMVLTLIGHVNDNM